MILDLPPIEIKPLLIVVAICIIIVLGLFWFIMERFRKGFNDASPFNIEERKTLAEAKKRRTNKYQK